MAPTPTRSIFVATTPLVMARGRRNVLAGWLARREERTAKTIRAHNNNEAPAPRRALPTHDTTANSRRPALGRLPPSTTTALLDPRFASAETSASGVLEQHLEGALEHLKVIGSRKVRSIMRATPAPVDHHLGDPQSVVSRAGAHGAIYWQPGARRPSRRSQRHQHDAKLAARLSSRLS